MLGLGGGLYIIPSSMAPSYSYNPNYRGFYVMTNDSSILIPENMTFEINTYENVKKLSFDYQYRVEEIGTYNFVFLFPFEVIKPLSDLYPLNYTLTPYGTAIWTSRQINYVGEANRVIGYFAINNTFQSGKEGEYELSFPLIWEYRPNGVVEELKKNLGLNYNVPQVGLEFKLYVTSSYNIDQVNPEPIYYNPNAIGRGNETVKKLVWYFDGLDLLQKQFIIRCRDENLISLLNYYVLLAGIFVSIGGSLVVKTAYDKLKEREIKKQLKQIKKDDSLGKSDVATPPKKTAET
jgi:hypothetical protein